MVKDDPPGQTKTSEQDILVLQDFALSKRLSQVPDGARIPDAVFQAISVALNFLVEEDSTITQHPDTNRG